MNSNHDSRIRFQCGRNVRVHQSSGGVGAEICDLAIGPCAFLESLTGCSHCDGAAQSH